MLIGSEIPVCLFEIILRAYARKNISMSHKLRVPGVGGKLCVVFLGAYARKITTHLVYFWERTLPNLKWNWIEGQSVSGNELSALQGIRALGRGKIRGHCQEEGCEANDVRGTQCVYSDGTETAKQR